MSATSAGVLLEFADYYNRDRPHRSLRLASPVPASVASIGEVASRPVLGGLHHVYYRAAWVGPTFAALHQLPRVADTPFGVELKPVQFL
jgi:hypothetical protein